VPQMADLGVAVMDTEAEGRRMLMRCMRDADQCDSQPLAELPGTLAEPLQQVLLHGQPVETNLTGEAATPLGGNGWPVNLQAALALPLRTGERTIGALLLGTRRPFPAFSTRDLSMLGELGSRAAMALDNAALYRSLQRESARSKEAEERLQESNRRKDEFLAMLSHELRNPLAPIRTAVEVIRRLAPPDPNLIMARDVVDRQVNHLVRLVEELLDVSRISEGKVALKKESIELGAVIKHSIETARPLIETRRQRLVVNTASTPIWLFGDFARLAQVVGNLVNNAAKYTQEGGRIEVTAMAHQGAAVIEVKDNGSGIDPRLLPRVFELFVQGERSLDRSQGGLGVGLTLVQRLVEMHQGRVEAVSEGIGRGSTFRVTLPCLAEVHPTEEEPTVSEYPARRVGRRVLVVDDNADAADSIAAYLRLEGHEVKTVNDGHAAVASCHVFAPHVVVLDIGLPGLDGYKVAVRLRQLTQTRDALLIALTGYGQKEDRARATEAGFDFHFVKPADPRELQKAIERDRPARAPTRQTSTS
jgi:signal transduction histidine kinase/ActR/RegA family two-component response regulator